MKVNQNAQPTVSPAPYIPKLPCVSPSPINTPPLPDRDNSMSPPHERPPRSTTPSSSSTRGITAARDTALSKQYLGYTIEAGKQQVLVNTITLDRFHTYENPTIYFNSLLTLPMRLHHKTRIVMAHGRVVVASTGSAIHLITTTLIVTKLNYRFYAVFGLHF